MSSSSTYRVMETRDRHVLQQYLLSRPALYLYQIGDLGDMFWPHTYWWLCLSDENESTSQIEIEEVAMLYCAPELGIATLLVFCQDEPCVRQRDAGGDINNKDAANRNSNTLAWAETKARALINALVSTPSKSVDLRTSSASELTSRFGSVVLALPRFEAHVTSSAFAVLKSMSSVFTISCEVPYVRMMYDASQAGELKGTNDENDNKTVLVHFKKSDADELMTLYNENYKGHCFEGRMLDTGFYFGVRDKTSGAILSSAGVHVVRVDAQMAALGNVCTDKHCRGRSYAQRGIRAVLKALFNAGVVHIGLNVQSVNESALRLYRRLGFHVVFPFTECVVTRV